MADLYGASPSPPPEPEEISFTFLHQLLQHGNHPSSASSSAKFTHHDFPSLHPPAAAAEMLDPTRFGRSDMECVNFSDPGGYFPQGSAEKRKAAISVENNDLGDASCDDSENGAEEVSDVPSNSGKSRSRSSSKRSRAAEVHNLSEKRRRSRINEKMKALQNLIPNSNKTDKASMLDEAIEYLKQLQLQVQMLTMRNGLSLHPMCLPGVLQPMHLPLTGMGFYEGTGLLNTNSVPGTFSANAGSSVQTGLLNVPSQCAISGQPIVAHPGTNVVSTETSFSYEPAVHHGSFSLSKEICRESSQQGQLDTNQSVKTSSGVS